MLIKYIEFGGLQMKGTIYERHEKSGFLHFKLNGIPIYLLLMFLVPLVVGMFTGSLGTDIGSTMA